MPGAFRENLTQGRKDQRSAGLDGHGEDRYQQCDVHGVPFSARGVFAPESSVRSNCSRYRTNMSPPNTKKEDGALQHTAMSCRQAHRERQLVAADTEGSHENGDDEHAEGVQLGQPGNNDRRETIPDCYPILQAEGDACDLSVACQPGQPTAQNHHQEDVGSQA